MRLQPEDFWSFYEWLMRPEAFLESAFLQGVVLLVLAIVLGLIVGYIISASRYGPGEGFYAVARSVRDLVRFDLPGISAKRVFALAKLAFKEAIRRKVLFVVGLFVVALLLAGWYLNPQSDSPARLYISFVLTATNYLILCLRFSSARFRYRPTSRVERFTRSSPNRFGRPKSSWAGCSDLSPSERSC